jgi:tetratricopeptide (TPR) repeat protein
MLQQIDKKYLACLLFFLSVLFFIRTKNYDAVWDDERGHFTPVFQSQMDHDIPAFWKSHSGMYIPLTYTTWAIVKRIAVPQGFKPAPFHVLNVLTHSINGVLLFYLLLLLFKNKTTAFFASMLFLLHPLQVESVAWISEFRGLYCTFFCLLSLLLFFTGLEKKQPGDFKALVFSTGFLYAFLFFILALLAKPSGIVLPFILLALAWRYYKGKTLLIGKALFLWLVPACIVIFLLLVKNPEGSVSFLQRFLIASYSLFFYLQKLIVPYPLVACYGYTPELIVANRFSVMALLISITLFAVLIYKRNVVPDLFTGFLIICICLSPVLGFIPFEYQKHASVADRYMYMAFLGVALFVPVVGDYTRKHPFFKLASAAVLLFFMILTMKQTSVWKNEFTLWDHTLAFYDNSSTVYYDRGVQYSLKKDFKNSLADYSRALELDPNNLDALFNRANAYENLGDAASAFKDYDTYLKNKKDGEVYFKRSCLYLKSGDLNSAFDDLQRAEEMRYSIDPKYKLLLLTMKAQPY